MHRWHLLIWVTTLNWISLSFANNWTTQPIPIDYSLSTSEHSDGSNMSKQNDLNDNVSSSSNNQDSFPQVSISDFFQRIQSCDGPASLASTIIKGKLYPLNQNICHFTYTALLDNQNSGNENSIGQKNFTVNCYVPLSDLLDTFATVTDESSSALAPTIPDNELTAQDLGRIPSFVQSTNGLESINRYCTTNVINNQFKSSQSQFEVNNQP